MIKKVKQSVVILVLLVCSFVATAEESEKKDGVKLGGALRYSIISTNYEGKSDNSNPQFTWDTWRLNADGSLAGIDISFEYRFYPSSNVHFVRYGYFGYKFSDVVYTKLGVTQVPFGILPSASHSFFFQAPYYLGLEDDYDMGINFEITPTDNIDIALAYFRSSEPIGSSRSSAPEGSASYSYNIIPGKGAYVTSNGDFIESQATISELDQFNARVAWRFTPNWEVGLSGQVGGIYNKELDKSETATAFAAHLTGKFNNFSLKTQFINYNYKAKDDNGNILDVVQMGAYGLDYPGGSGYTGGVAAKANIYEVGLAYSIPVKWGPISNIQPYIDYSYVDKANKHFYNSQQLLPGIMVTAGPIYSYIEYVMGKNQPWFTNDFGKGFGSGIANADWNKRININIGYYF